MNYKMALSIFFLWSHSLAARDVISDHAGISAKAQCMHELSSRKQACFEMATKIGAAALCGSILYYIFSSSTDHNNAVTVKLPAELVNEIKESPQLIKKALEYYTASKNSWGNSTCGALVKFTGSLVLQSVVLQGLQPIYQAVQHYFFSKFSILPLNFWFLAEQYADSSEELSHKKIEIEQEFYDFLMHVESLEYAYKNNQVELIKNSAQVILSHIVFIKEYKTFYLYQKHILQRCYESLTEIIHHMACDASNGIIDDTKLDAYKNKLRELRKLPIYSII